LPVAAQGAKRRCRRTDCARCGLTGWRRGVFTVETEFENEFPAKENELIYRNMIRVSEIRAGEGQVEDIEKVRDSRQNRLQAFTGSQAARGLVLAGIVIDAGTTPNG